MSIQARTAARVVVDDTPQVIGTDDRFCKVIGDQKETVMPYPRKGSTDHD